MLRIKKEKPECLPIEKVIFKMLAHPYNGYTHYESYDLEFCFQSTQKKEDQFTLHQKQPKKKKFPQTKLHKTTVSKTLYTRQQMTAIPERWETNEGSPNIAPRSSPWESFQSMAQGGEIEWERHDFPESRRQELRLEELELTGQNARKKRST